MSLSLAYINIQILLQNYLPLPYFYDKQTNRLIWNSKLDTKKPWKLPIWHFQKLLATFFGTFVPTYHIYTLWYNPLPPNREEIMIHCLILFSSLQYFASWLTFELCSGYHADLVTEIYWQNGIKYEGWPWPYTNRIPEFPELVGYGLALGFFFFPFCAAAFPFFRQYDPVQLVITGIFPSASLTALQITSSILTSFCVVFAALVCLLQLLVTTSCLSIYYDLAKQNYLMSLHNGNLIAKKSDIAVRMIKKLRIVLRLVAKWKHRKCLGWNKVGFTSKAIGNEILFENRPSKGILTEKFTERLLSHRKLSVLVSSSNECIRFYIPLMTAAGMSLVVVSIFGVIRLYNQLEIMFYLVIAFFAVFIPPLIIFFCQYSSKPSYFSIEMIRFWKSDVVVMSGRLEKRQMWSMRSIGFKMGQFFIVNNNTALNLLDTILQNTIAVLVV